MVTKTNSEKKSGSSSSTKSKRSLGKKRKSSNLSNLDSLANVILGGKGGNQGEMNSPLLPRQRKSPTVVPTPTVNLPPGKLTSSSSSSTGAFHKILPMTKPTSAGSETGDKGNPGTSHSVASPPMGPSVLNQETLKYATEQFVKVKTACINCRKSRVKCDKLLPCSRCRRLGTECRPQLRGRGRPPTYKPPGDDIPGDDATQPRRPLGRKRSKPSNTGSESSVDMASDQPQVVMSKPVNGIEIITSEFNNLLVQGKVFRDGAIGVVRQWALEARQQQNLMLKEQSEKLSKLLCSSLEDIHSQTSHSVDPVRAYEEIPKQFKFRDEWDSHDAAYMQRTVINGVPTFICNAAFQTLFCSAEDLTLGRRRLEDIFHAEDAVEFYQSMSRALFTASHGGGNLIRHCVRLQVNYCQQAVLGLVYFHNYTSQDGRISHSCIRILLLPLSKHYSQIDEPMINFNMLPILPQKGIEPGRMSPTSALQTTSRPPVVTTPYTTTVANQQRNPTPQQAQSPVFVPMSFQQMVHMNRSNVSSPILGVHLQHLQQQGSGSIPLTHFQNYSKSSSMAAPARQKGDEPGAPVGNEDKQRSRARSKVMDQTKVSLA